MTKVHGIADLRQCDMDYDKMKALMEANREVLAGQRKAEVKEFPKPDSKPNWKYLDCEPKERIAA